VKLAVVIPAFNEEQLLPGCIASVRATLGEFADVELELIVVDNNSTDQTAQVAAREGARVVFESKNQIARARNAGAAEAQADWLLFLDADSRLNPGLAAELRQAMAAGDRVACGTAMYMPGAPRWARAMLQIWNLAGRTFHWAAGSFLACRRDAFLTVGGFNEDLFAAEEIDLSRRLKQWARPRGLGFPVFRRHPLETSPRKLELYTGREIAAQFARLLFRPVRSLRNREALAIWYDGRR